MAYLVELSQTAETEVLEAFVWKGERSFSAASQWYNGLMAAIASLEEQPKRCPLAPDNAAMSTVSCSPFAESLCMCFMFGMVHKSRSPR